MSAANPRPPFSSDLLSSSWIEKMKKTILVLLLFLLVVSPFLFQLIPRYRIGHISQIGELEKKYPSCHITNFKSTGPLVFIEQRQWSSWTIVVWGIFQDDIDIFQKDARSRNVNIFDDSNPFFVYAYAYDYGNKQLPVEDRLPIRKIATAQSNSGYNYEFVNDKGETTSRHIQIGGDVESTHFGINIDPVSKKFVLNLEIRH